MMRWYFSRPTSDTDTAFESAIREHFSIFHLENPNATLHQKGYSTMGIEYLYFAIAMLPAYDGCIALDLPNGRWSAGVSREVNWFLQYQRPVMRVRYKITPEDQWSFRLELLTAPLVEPYSVEQTRAFVHYYQGRPHGGRSYDDQRRGLHTPDWSAVGLDQPARVKPPPMY